MPLPFFCTICDKPITPSRHRKYATIHEKCMKDYLANFRDEFSKDINTTDLPRKPKK